MPKVSVIMPSLNVARYIRTCMDSVLGQTLADIEVLAIDAGSDDGTLEILREYERSDPRVHVIVSKKKSYGYQMNLGLDAARGEYVGIVETDDFIEHDMYEHLVAVSDDQSLDYAKGFAYEFYDLPGGGHYSFEIAKLGSESIPFGKVLCPAEMPELLQRDIFIWLGIYRRSFLQNIRFNETSGAAFQDQGFLLKTLSTAKRAMYVDMPVYWYRHDNFGASLYDPRGFKYINDEYSINESVAFSLNDKWKAFFYARLWIQVNGRYSVMALSGNHWEGIEAYVDAIRKKLKRAESSGILRFDILASLEHALLKLFLVKPDEVFGFFRDEYAIKLKNANQLLSWAEGHTVMVYSAGKWGKFAHAFLAVKGKVQIAGFIDSNSTLQGTKIQGLDVFSPDEAIKLFPEAYYLIANKHHGDEIERFLISKGIAKDKIGRYSIECSPLLLMANYG